MSFRRLRGVALAIVIAVVAAVGLGAASAQASSLSLQFEPAYTKGTTNQWYTTQLHSNDDDYYYVCASAADNGVAIAGEQSNGSNGPGTSNCLGNTATGTTTTAWALSAGTPKLQGHKYEMCLTDYHDWPLGGGAIFWSMQSTLCQSTILDASKPVVTTGINGTDEYTKDPSVTVRIGYDDSISPPWSGADGRAANLVCFAQGASCTPVNYDPNCSVPAAWSRVTFFVCSATLPGDGKWFACTRSSDRAIPERRDWANASSNEANVSDPSCGWITVDRVAPTVTVDASATTVHAGELVTFGAQAADATSGVKPGFAWTFGDNTAGANGATASHTYTQPGTYVVSAAGSDGAGNSGSGTKTITVLPAATGGGNGGTGGGGATGASGMSGAGGTPHLDVSAPKRLAKGSRKLSLALTATTSGTIRVALVKQGKVVATGTKKLAGAGTYAYKLKLPKKLAPGSYKLKVTFSGKTRTLKLRVSGTKAKAATATVTTKRG